MARVVRRIGRDPELHFVVLDTDSSGTAAQLVQAHLYVSGRPIQDYLPEDIIQLDLDGLEEVDQQPITEWAVFSNAEEGYSARISPWLPREAAEEALTSLLENGESSVHLASRQV